MREPRRPFCSDAARLRGDDNAATAARVDLWILVEFPCTWGREPMTDSALPPAVRSALERAEKEIPRSRVIFIRKRVEPPRECRVYIVRAAPMTGVLALDLPSIDDVATVPFAALAAERLRIAERPLVLVCTHGQHDSCCGRRGYPLFDALREQEGIDVWQCSHIGGDRFAANALVLPWGIYYGPVEPRDAKDLVDTAMRGDILIPAYRGRSSMSRPAQAAETFVRRATNVTGRDALRVLSRETLVDGRMRIHVREKSGVIHEVTIEHYTATESAFPTCSTRVEQPVRQFRLVSHSIVEP
ncbi:MAG TPA: sucrase ferredoxin [Thermoanaerobaculia bacterium]|nr:sucrase ferredoxin [Thermoanaerobaculia bacterium]